MRQAKSAVSSITSAPVIIVALFLILSVSSGNSPPSFPRLRAAETSFYPGESARYDIYTPDHFTRLKTVIEYPDSTTETITYSANGAVEQREQLYPANAAGVRITKRLEQYDRDGRILMIERTNRPDGTASVIGSRLPDRSYEISTFAEDGISVLEHRIYNPTNTLLLAQAYSAAGVLEVEKIRRTDGTYAESHFDEEGVLVSTIFSSAMGNTAATYYYHDGVTAEYTFTQQTGSSLTILHNRPDGSLQERRVMDIMQGLSVIIYDTEGKPIIRQMWSKVFGNPNASYVLTRVDELADYNGQTKTVRMIYFAADGVTVTRIALRWDVLAESTLDFEWTLAEDGTIETVTNGNVELTPSEAPALPSLPLPDFYTTLSSFPVSPVSILYDPGMEGR